MKQIVTIDYTRRNNLPATIAVETNGAARFSAQLLAAPGNPSVR